MNDNINRLAAALLVLVLPALAGSSCWCKEASLAELEKEFQAVAKQNWSDKDWQHSWITFSWDMEAVLKKGGGVAELNKKFQGKTVEWEGQLVSVDRDKGRATFGFQTRQLKRPRTTPIETTDIPAYFKNKQGIGKQMIGINPAKKVRFHAVVKNPDGSPPIQIIEGSDHALFRIVLDQLEVLGNVK